MPVSGRRRSMDDRTPCRTTDRPKRRHRHTHTHFTAATKNESDSHDGSARDSSEMLLFTMMLAGGGGSRCKSSRGSCGAWSMQSLLDHCPTSPSPVLSPVSSVSCTPPSALSQLSTADARTFLTPNPSSCIKSSDGKKPTPEGANLDGRKASNANRHLIFDSIVPMRTNRVDGQRTVSQRLAPKPTSQADGSFRTAGVRFPSNPCESCPFDNERRLLAVSEEVEYKNERSPTGSPRLFSDDGDYSLGSEDGYRSSDIESMTEERLGSETMRPLPSSSMERKRDEVEYLKLSAWKEAKTLKIMNKLRDKEVAVERWVENETAKAKRDVKQLEMKLEKQRCKAMVKMQRKIKLTQKKAEKKKLKEQAITNRKISRVGQVFEKIADSRTAPWKLIVC